MSIQANSKVHVIHLGVLPIGGTLHIDAIAGMDSYTDVQTILTNVDDFAPVPKNAAVPQPTDLVLSKIMNGYTLYSYVADDGCLDYCLVKKA